MKRLFPLAALLFAMPAFADDWPHWMGPKGDNTWREDGIIDKFPKDGPKVLWRTPINGGYSGPAVVAGRVYITDLVTDAKDDGAGNFQRKSSEGKERVLCIDAKSGKELWKHEYPVKYTVSYPCGPRCTPTVADGKVYFLGAEGDLLCCDAAKGDILWQKNLKNEYNTKSALWGYAGHPLVDGKKLITLAGGKGSHVVALDKDTGKEIWKAGDAPEQGYCPPTIFDVFGERQLIIPAPDAVRAHDPETGKELWSVPYNATSGSIIMTPLKFGEHLYVGGYQNKNLLLKLAKGKAPEVVWQDKAKLGIAPVNVQPFALDNFLVGLHENGAMFGVAIPSGERVWETPQPVAEDRPKPSGTAFIVKNGDRFFFFVENGDLAIGTLSKTGYTEIDRAKELVKPVGKAMGRNVVWSQPAFADRKMFVRNDKEIICVDLAKPKS